MNGAIVAGTAGAVALGLAGVALIVHSSESPQKCSQTTIRIGWTGTGIRIEGTW